MQRHILFTFLAAAISLTSGRMLPFSSHVCFFYFNEIVNQERSESCYITETKIREKAGPTKIRVTFTKHLGIAINSTS